MKIVWSPLAIQRVIEITEYIALDKPGAAAGWAESVLRSVDRLEHHPESGRVVPEMGRREVREVIHGAYRIVYRIEDGRVLVLTVRGSRQRFDPSEAE